MKNDDYSGTPIIKNPWPEWTPLEAGAFARRWKFEFERPPQEELISADGLDDAELQIALTRGDSRAELIATTTTKGNAWSDAIFFTAFYRLFERLEARFGRLRTIQGQARDQWRPFRNP